MKRVPRYQKVKTKKDTRSTERARLEVLKREIERENPSIIFTPSNVKLMKLVGSLPYSPLEKDKEDIAKVLAREYL